MKSRLIECGFEIGGIPTVVVDPHHHVLPTWVEYFEGQKVNLVHVDTHRDMGDIKEGCPKPIYDAWHGREIEIGYNAKSVLLPGDVDALDDYVVNVLWEGNYIIPAVHSGLINSLYYFIPNEKVVGEFLKPFKWYVGWSQLTTQPLVVSGEIIGLGWRYKGERHTRSEEKLGCRPIPLDEAYSELQEVPAPIILNIDLDVFGCIEPYTKHSDLSERAYKERFDKTFQFFEGLPQRPSLITIAKSQTPNTYVDPRKVNRFLRDTIDGLAKLYEK